MFGRLAMSACAGQRTSGEASGWVWWSSSRTDWNHGHGCSHGDGASQPKQQGSTVQLLNIISSPVPLSACGAQLEAAAAHQNAGRPRPAAGWGHAHMYGLCPHAQARLSNPDVSAFLRGRTFMLKLSCVPRTVKPYGYLPLHTFTVEASITLRLEGMVGRPADFRLCTLAQSTVPS